MSVAMVYVHHVDLDVEAVVPESTVDAHVARGWTAGPLAAAQAERDAEYEAAVVEAEENGRRAAAARAEVEAEAARVLRIGEPEVTVHEPVEVSDLDPKIDKPRGSRRGVDPSHSGTNNNDPEEG